MHLPLLSRLPMGLLLPLFVSAQVIPHTPQYSTHNYYVLEHDPSSFASVADVAHALGVDIVQQAGELRNHWLVRTPKSAKPGHDPVLSIHRAIQTGATSSHHLATRSVEAHRARHLSSSIRSLLPQTVRQRVKRDGYLAARAPPPTRPTTDKNDSSPSISPAHALASRLGIVDPIFPDQWHLVNEGFPEHMMNVTPVWEELGITGKGVYVAMVDDGVDYDHDDIKDNFVSI
jgi:kexin